MKTYDINKGKRNSALNQLIKENVGEAKGIVKACYRITKILRVLAVVLGLGTIIYVFATHKDPVDLLFLLITVGIPYALSFIPATVYKMSLAVDYKYRRKERLTVQDDMFVYSFCDTRTGFHDTVFNYIVKFDAIDKVNYNEKTNLLNITGDMVVDTYEDNELKESGTFAIIDFLNCFDVDVYQLIKEKMRKE